MPERPKKNPSQTSPKGRPTPRRDSVAKQQSSGSGLTGWVVLGVVAVGLVVAAFVFGPSGSGTTVHSGAQTISP